MVFITNWIGWLSAQQDGGQVLLVEQGKRLLRRLGNNNAERFVKVPHYSQIKF